MKVRVIVTGGTIDKQYNKLNGSLEFCDTRIFKMLELGRCRVDVVGEVLLKKDSLEMMDEDRQLILSRCLACDEKHIVITHGTDTMVKTATVLGQNIGDKTIVLSGAMIPFMVQESDALFNLGSALAVVQCLSPGVYVVMNGKVFCWDNVVKNLQEGAFEALDAGASVK